MLFYAILLFKSRDTGSDSLSYLVFVQTFQVYHYGSITKQIMPYISGDSYSILLSRFRGVWKNGISPSTSQQTILQDPLNPSSEIVLPITFSELQLN